MEWPPAMTIEIHRPELEALILERMKLGGFQNVEDVLMQALEASPVTDVKSATAAKGRTGADLIAAMQSSPFREIEIEPARYRMPVRDVSF
jgi:hypothetical protein